MNNFCRSTFKSGTCPRNWFFSDLKSTSTGGLPFVSYPHLCPTRGFHPESLEWCLSFLDERKPNRVILAASEYEWQEGRCSNEVKDLPPQPSQTPAYFSLFLISSFSATCPYLKSNFSASAWLPLCARIQALWTPCSFLPQNFCPSDQNIGRMFQFSFREKVSGMPGSFNLLDFLILQREAYWF